MDNKQVQHLLGRDEGNSQELLAVVEKQATVIPTTKEAATQGQSRAKARRTEREQTLPIGTVGLSDHVVVVGD